MTQRIRHFLVRAFSLHPLLPSAPLQRTRNFFKTWPGGVSRFVADLTSAEMIGETRCGLILRKGALELGRFDAVSLVCDDMQSVDKLRTATAMVELLTAILDNDLLEVNFSFIARETLDLIRQLRELGHGVTVQYDSAESQSFRDECAAWGVRFLRAQHTYGRAFWARDQYVKIAGRRERPSPIVHGFRQGPYQNFGEGGAMVEIAPRAYAVHETLMLDPRIRGYQKQGYEFFPLASSLCFSPTWTQALGRPTYWEQSHIDMGGITAVPKKKILVANPWYFRDHRDSVKHLSERFNLRTVVVDPSEATRHPENFLLLDPTTALVDAGAPVFIEQLRAQGVAVVPTTQPLDYLGHAAGKIRCLFNEM